MRSLLVLSVICVSSMATGLCQASATPLERSPFTITIQALDVYGRSDAPIVVKAGQPVSINIQLTNLTNEEMNVEGFWSLGVDYTYYYDVRDTSGNLRKKRLLTDHPFFVGSERDEKVAPGMSKKEKIDVDLACDIKEPGTYTIQVSRDVPGDPKHRIVKSNLVTVTLVP
jgi:hypothetical protein